MKNLSGFRSQVSGFASAFLRGDPFERAVYRAENMGAAARHGGDAESSTYMPTRATCFFDKRGVHIKRHIKKIFV